MSVCLSVCVPRIIRIQYLVIVFGLWYLIFVLCSLFFVLWSLVFGLLIFSAVVVVVVSSVVVSSVVSSIVSSIVSSLSSVSSVVSSVLSSVVIFVVVVLFICCRCHQRHFGNLWEQLSGYLYLLAIYDLQLCLGARHFLECVGRICILL